LDIPELDKEDLKNLKKRSESIEENIQNMKNTYVWLWGQAADEEAKQKIVNKFLEQNSVK
jgi:tetrahydromethanopterin S-methyltransferase subunit G